MSPRRWAIISAGAHLRGILASDPEAKKMRSLTELLTDSDECTAKQIASVLTGLDELDEYVGYRTRQCFSILMAFPTYVEFRELNDKLRGKTVKKLDPDSEQYQSFTVKVPTHPFLQFRSAAFELRNKLPKADRDLYTMTAWTNVATAKFLIPAHYELLARCSEDPDFRKAIIGNKTKYNLTAFISAAIQQCITPAVREAIKLAVEDNQVLLDAGTSDRQAA
jgi:hypothetical protein